MDCFPDERPSGLPDPEGPVRAGFATGHRVYGEPLGTVRTVLVGAPLQHIEPAAKHAEGCDPPYHTKEGLHLLIGSTGIKVAGEGEWQHRKHGGSKRRIWRKVQIAVDEQTLELRAVEVTFSAIGDCPLLPEVLNQIPQHEEIADVTAGGAYDTRACHDAIAARGAVAVIPPRKNARLWKPPTDGSKARNDALRPSKRLGRVLWRKWSGYHRRSRVETKMNCIKQLGQRLMARAFDRQLAEVQIRAVILNRFTALGTPTTARVV